MADGLLLQSTRKVGASYTSNIRYVRFYREHCGWDLGGVSHCEVLREAELSGRLSGSVVQFQFL